MGNEEGWVKLPRALLDFAWFDDPLTVHVYVYLLLNARRVDGMHHERVIKRGQLATSIPQIAAATNSTVQPIRTVLARLKKAGLISVEWTNKYSVITLTDYDGEESKKKTTPKAVSDLPEAETPVNVQPFIPPTLEEVRAFFEQYGFRQGGQYWNRVDEIERFYDYYKSKGWMVGQNVMCDWKAAARNWIRKQPYGSNNFRSSASTRDAEKERRDREYAELMRELIPRPPT